MYISFVFTCIIDLFVTMFFAFKCLNNNKIKNEKNPTILD